MTDKKQQIKRAIIDSLSAALAAVSITGESVKTLNGEVLNNVIQEMVKSATASPVVLGVAGAPTPADILINSFAGALKRSIDAPAAPRGGATSATPSSAPASTPAVDCSTQDADIKRLDGELAAAKKLLKDLEDVAAKAAADAAAAAQKAASTAVSCQIKECKDARVAAAHEKSTLEGHIIAKDAIISQCTVNIANEKKKVSSLEADKQALEAEKQALEAEKQALEAEKQALEAEKTKLDRDLALLRIEIQELQIRCADDTVVTNINNEVEAIELTYGNYDAEIARIVAEIQTQEGLAEAKINSMITPEKQAAATAVGVHTYYDLKQKCATARGILVKPVKFVPNTSTSLDNAGKITAAQHALTSAQEYVDNVGKYMLAANKFITACKAVAAVTGGTGTGTGTSTGTGTGTGTGTSTGTGTGTGLHSSPDGLQDGAYYYNFDVKKGEIVAESKYHAPKMLKLLQDVGTYLKDIPRAANLDQWEKILPTSYPLVSGTYCRMTADDLMKFGIGTKTLINSGDGKLTLNCDPKPNNFRKSMDGRYESSVKVWNMINFMKYLRSATIDDDVIKIKNLWYADNASNTLDTTAPQVSDLITSYWWGSPDKVNKFIEFLLAYAEMAKTDPPADLVDTKYLYEKIDENASVLAARKAWCRMRNCNEDKAEMFRLYLL
jgi:hypothetical protein